MLFTKFSFHIAKDELSNVIFLYVIVPIVSFKIPKNLCMIILYSGLYLQACMPFLILYGLGLTKPFTNHSRIQETQVYIPFEVSSFYILTERSAEAAERLHSMRLHIPRMGGNQRGS